jgi:hypothetical protein
MELVESQGWASLTAYKEHFFPTPPPPPQAVPSPAEAALNPSPALRQEHSDEFIFYGKSRLDHLIYRPWSSPLHYSKLLNLVHLSAGESGRVLPLSVDTPGAVELAQGIQQLEGAVTGQHWARGCNKFMALVYAAYGDYKAAHDIDIWANSVSSTGERIIRPDQDWRDYWLLYREANVASQIAYRRSGREWFSPERPGYGIGLRATVTHLCEFEVPKAKQLLAALPDDKRGHSLHSLHAAAQDGWTAELLVARSVLTLWALLAVVPILGGTVDPTTSSTMAVTPMEQQFQLWPAEYSQHVLANPEARVPRLGS